MSGLLLWLLVLLPAVVGGSLCLLRPPGRVATVLALATAGAGVILAVQVAITRPAVAVPFMAGTDFALKVDALSALVVPTVTAVTFLVLVFSAGDIREARARFFGLMLLFSAAAALTATAATLPVLLLAWEIMGAASYALIGFWPVCRCGCGACRRGRFPAKRPCRRGKRVAACHRCRSPGRGARQGGSVAVLVLAVTCHGRPQPGERSAPFGGHGRDGRLPAAPD